MIYRLLLIAVFLAVFLINGCADRRVDTVPPSLGPKNWHCDAAGNCEIIQSCEPSQLTPVGCAFNWVMRLGMGRTPAECRRGIERKPGIGACKGMPK